MKCTILSIGDELLIGQTLNTNAFWISQKMNEIGVDVIHHISLSDEKNDIISCLNDALEKSNIVLITGGLGPTSDDITKDVLCSFFGGKLVFNEAAYANIERIFSNRKHLINEATKQVAFLPDCCEVIQNKNGTAAGMIFTKDNKTVVSMPGVPYEMQSMISDDVIPYLKEKYQLSFIFHRNILTAGVGETVLADRLIDFEKNKDERIKIAYLPSVGKVRLRLTIKGDNEDELKAIIEAAEQEVVSKINEFIFGYDDETLEQSIGKMLLENNLQLGTAESCTGGYLAHLITSVSGSSAYYKGSVIAYSNEIKNALLNVDETILNEHGAVSEATVNAMINGAISQLNVDISIAISGVAGPSGGTAEKPVGTVFIGVGNKQTSFVKKYLFTKNRERNIQIAAVVALVMLRKFIKDNYS
ncbi:MAG: competence/damage-inducible protein A [Chitinophagales bacterium]